MSSTTANDKTVNKVALCSAIFAGFAYVGYSVVRTAFGKKGKNNGEEEHRLYFRRLSQTTQTDILLGNLDVSGSGKVMLRSITVQERIKELNLRARMFADTMLAIQAAGNSPRHHRIATKSLQPSPWSSPRVLSPVDLQYMDSHSTENLCLLDGQLEFNASPIKKRWARRSFIKKAQIDQPQRSFSPEQRTDIDYQNACEEAELLCREQGDDLKLMLNNLHDKTGRAITPYEAKCLAALLYSEDEETIQKSLITIANFCTFEQNQDTYREAGGLMRLPTLVTHPNKAIQIAAITAVGNLCLNMKNQKQLKDCVPLLIAIVKDSQVSDDVASNAFRTLTNFSVLSDYHDLFYPVLHRAYQIVDSGSPSLKLCALKLLVNLSANEDMVPSLLAAQAPRRLIYLVDESTNEEILLRVVTLLSNIVQVAKAENIDPTIDLPAEDKAASPETIRYASIYGVNTRERLLSKIFYLMNNHKNEDIRAQCKKIYQNLHS